MTSLALGSALVPVTASAGAAVRPHLLDASSEPVKGIAVSMAFANRLTDARTMQIANELMSMIATNLHANAVSLNFPLWQYDSRSDDPRRAPMTPSPQRMIAVTEIAHHYGLSVQWRPYLYEGDLVYETHNSIFPGNPSLWMANYWTFLRPYLIAANLANVASFSIGVELRSMLPYLSQWTTLVRQAKSVYSGTIIYSQQHIPEISIPLTASGYDAYQPIPLSSTKLVSAAAFTRGFRRILHFPAMQSTPQDTTLEEVGITATSHAYLHPAASARRGSPMVRKVQTDWFEGACNAFWQLHLAGIYFYAITFNRYRPGENDSSNYGAWLGTPTAGAVANCFSRDVQAPASTVPTSPRSATRSRAASTLPTTNWDPATAVEPTGGHATSIACPTAAFCAEVDLAGDVRTEANGIWSAPVRVDPNALVQISCAAATLCVAVDDAGSVVQYGGGAWSHPLGVDATPLSAISCAIGTETCVAVDVGGRALTDHAGTWSAPTTLSTSPLTAISCASPTFCMAVDDGGVAFHLFGTAWSVAGRLGPTALTAVACSSVTTCLIGDDQGTLYQYASGTWQHRQSAVPGGIVSIACLTTTRCDAVGPEGVVTVGSGLQVGSIRAIFPGDQAVAITCPAPGGPCIALSYGGSTATGALTWIVTHGVDPRSGALTAVSCGAAKFCMAVDDAGNATTWNGSKWSQLTKTGLSSASAVSCAGTYCMVVSNTGQAVSYQSGKWGTVHMADRQGALTAVSCLSSVFCAATDASHHVQMFNGRRWLRPTTGGVPQLTVRGWVAVACASRTVCLAVDTYGEILEFGTPPATLLQADTPFLPLTAISCGSASWCIAVDDQGRAITLTISGSAVTYSAPRLIDTYRLTSISCTAAGTCLATDDAGGTVSYANGVWAAPSRAVPLSGTITAAACAGAGTCATTDSDSVAVASVG